MHGQHIDRKSLATGTTNNIYNSGVAGRYIGWLSGQGTPASVIASDIMWDDVVEEEAPKPAEAPAEVASDAPAPDAAAGAAAEEGAKPEEAIPPQPENPLNAADKRLVCKHWVRPKFLQYNYIYDYQRNYYDDLISYIDKRNHGIPVERPQPQTWGERALRTYLSRGYSYSTKKYSKDTTLLNHISVGAKFQRAHTKSLISRKYSKLGINSVYL
ncbi:unnamed protein product [Danaus chrysippus]|uniref:(African queen) hypothetical protein n=1 Tax=Danaus chrysippus TaxID=151541 RepID=A0A8J2Q7Z3_9NEOP|nr:unnamed protein product [Danaus chrysippus]